MWIKEWNIKTITYSYTISKYDNILTVSSAVLNEFVANRRIKEKGVVIGNPIDVHEIQKKEN